MTKRTLQQIEESLRIKLHEAEEQDDQMKYMGDIGSKGPHRGSPVQDPGAFAGLPGGTGKASVWRGPSGERMSKPRPLQKPRVTATKPEVSSIGKNKPGGPAVWRRGGEESFPPLSTKDMSPQEKLLRQAQQRAKDTGETTIAVTEPKLAAVLDKVLGRWAKDADQQPAPKGRVEPTLGFPKNTNEAAPDKETKAAYSREQFMSWAKQYSQQYGVPLGLVLHAMNKETGHIEDPNKAATAVSPAGAVGVMQMLPGTGAQYKLNYKDLKNPQKNIQAGVRYLADLYNKYDQNPISALAAYNSGPGTVDAYLTGKTVRYTDPKTGKVKVINPKGRQTENGVPPYKETRKYVKDFDLEQHQQETGIAPGASVGLKPDSNVGLRAKSQPQDDQIDEPVVTAPTKPKASAATKPAAVAAPTKTSASSTADWKDIYNLNKSVIGRNPDDIKPGQKLKMPDGSTYTVKAGDSLSKIASSTTTAPSTSARQAQSVVVKPQPEITPQSDRQVKLIPPYEPADVTASDMEKAGNIGYKGMLMNPLTGLPTTEKELKAQVAKMKQDTAVTGTKAPATSTAPRTVSKIKSDKPSIKPSVGQPWQPPEEVIPAMRSGSAGEPSGPEKAAVTQPATSKDELGDLIDVLQKNAGNEKANLGSAVSDRAESVNSELADILKLAGRMK